jgi:hypothetical protein
VQTGRARAQSCRVHPGLDPSRAARPSCLRVPWHRRRLAVA